MVPFKEIPCHLLSIYNIEHILFYLLDIHLGLALLLLLMLLMHFHWRSERHLITRAVKFSQTQLNLLLQDLLWTYLSSSRSLSLSLRSKRFIYKVAYIYTYGRCPGRGGESNSPQTVANSYEKFRKNY